MSDHQVPTWLTYCVYGTARCSGQEHCLAADANLLLPLTPGHQFRQPDLPTVPLCLTAGDMPART
jgi:hypothetical protein